MDQNPAGQKPWSFRLTGANVRSSAGISPAGESSIRSRHARDAASRVIRSARLGPISASPAPFRERPSPTFTASAWRPSAGRRGSASRSSRMEAMSPNRSTRRRIDSDTIFAPLFAQHRLACFAAADFGNRGANRGRQLRAQSNRTLDFLRPQRHAIDQVGI